MSVMLDEEIEGGIVLNPNSELAKELRKWEQFPGIYGKTPGNPYVYREYPRLLYKAQKLVNGKYSVGEVPPDPMLFETAAKLERATLMVERFNKSCQLVVGNDQELSREHDKGWRKTQQEALDYAEALEIDMATAAAEAAFHAKRMSASAQAEFAKANAETHEHIVDVQPKRKRGRPAKGTIAIAGSGEVED